MNTKLIPIFSTAAAALLVAGSAHAEGEWTANAAATNNYIWRGLTQSTNQAAVSGGIDFAAANGFYAGTWASNVSYAPGDVFSYEHDVYFGFSGSAGDFGYDVGYLYYNYDDAAEFDFGEIYGSVSFASFSAGLSILANTEAKAGPNQDFGFGQAYYASLDYATEIRPDLELGLHIGYHDGDFNEAFNGVSRGYVDFNVSLAKDGFSFVITSTDLSNSGFDGLDNDALKFVVGYSMDFEL